MFRRIRSAIWQAIFLIAVIISPACKNRRPNPEATTAALQTPSRPSRVIGLGRIEPELKILGLASEVQGIIVRINAQPGDHVAKGEVIIELTRAIEEAKIEQVESKARTHLSDVEAVKAALAAATIRAENARIAYERAKTLVEQDAQAKVTFDNAEADYKALIEDIKRFEAGVTSAENVLSQDRADLRLARAGLDQRSIRAPADGRMLSLDVTAGSLVAPETVFGSFAPDSPLTAWCEIDELFAAYIKNGQRAYVRTQGLTEETGRGTVVFAGPYLRKKSLFSDEVGDLEDRRVREVRIRLEPDSSLLIGSRVECVIMLEK